VSNAAYLSGFRDKHSTSCGGFEPETHTHSAVGHLRTSQLDQCDLHEVSIVSDLHVTEFCVSQSRIMQSTTLLVRVLLRTCTSLAGSIPCILYVYVICRPGQLWLVSLDGYSARGVLQIQTRSAYERQAVSSYF